MAQSLKDKGLKALIPFAHPLFSLWFGSCRPRMLHQEYHEAFFLNQNPFIAVTWHRASIFFCYYYGPFHPMVMFSQSPDGEYLARFAQRCGVVPVRGSSTRGGERALIQMIRFLRQGNRICSTVLDGPQGPPYKAKTGLLFLAKKTGLPLLPIIWSSPKAITLENTWDRTMIPKPFSPVVINYGPPMFVPSDCPDSEMERIRKGIEDRLNGLMVEADHYCGYKTRW
ncbi:MAG: lysophospholipid acyltransferase family protein [Thermodesulfobacteriota bacterium]